MKKEYQKRGISMREHKIERNLLEKAGAEFEANREAVKQRALLSKQSARTLHFE